MRATRIGNTLKLVALGFTLMGAAGCATTTAGAGIGTDLGPTLSVERFLNAANGRDHAAMMNLFGTAAGPLGDTGSTFGCSFKRMGSWIGLGDRCMSKQNLELRMDAIARIIRHNDYRIRSEERVAGRTAPTTQVDVDLDLGPRVVSGVPFVVVRTDDGDWLVQEIGLELLTS